MVQSFSDFEVLVCDDGSIDNSKQVVERYFSRLNIKYFFSENFGGPARPRNIGLSRANGKYVAFLDSDDWWHPEKIRVSVEALEAGSDFVYHDLFIHTEKRSRLNWNNKLRSRQVSAPVFQDLLDNGNAIINSSVMVKKSLMNQISGFSEDITLVAWEDYDAWLKVSKVTNRFKRIKGCFGWYSLGGDNISSAERTEKAVEKIIETHFEKMEDRVPAWVNYTLARAYLQLGRYEQSKQYAVKIGLSSLSWRYSFKAGLVYFFAEFMRVSSVLNRSEDS